MRAARGNQGFSRTLHAGNLISLGLGVIIGAGILVITGTVAAQYTGPAIVISLIIAGFACALTGLCYAEFASMIPVSGSAYTYAYATMGELVAWILGWNLILEYLIGASAVAIGWSGYFVSFLAELGYQFPTYLARPPIDDQGNWTGAYFNLPAVFIIVLLAYVLIIGIRESVRFNQWIVLIKLTVLVIFIGIGLTYFEEANWQPFIPPNAGTFGVFGWSGVLRGAGLMYFAYIGFDAISTTAQETRNPQKNVPIGILGSLVLAVLIYALVALAMTGLVDYRKLNVADPLAQALDNVSGLESGTLWGLRLFVKLGSLVGLGSVMLVLLLAQPRIFYAMGVDGLLPKSFTRLHPRYRTPYVTTLLSAGIAGLIAGISPVKILTEMVSIGTLLAFIWVCLGIFILRYTQPNLERPFRVPFAPFVPLLGAICSITVMVTLPINTWLRLLTWMLLGLVIYGLYGIRNSTIHQSEK